MRSETSSGRRRRSPLLERAPERTNRLSPLAHVDGIELRRIVQASASWLEKHASHIDALNVFPVPDGDTGTNMSLTLRAALAEMRGSRAGSAGEVCATLAHGALLGARGNSGVILSQIIRGFAQCVGDRNTIDARTLAQALAEGAGTAFNAVVNPVEGTILTVARQAAQAAADAARRSDDLRLVVKRTMDATRVAVAATPQLLPVLREAGVVDAGGQGLFVMLEGACKYLHGEPMDTARVVVGAKALEHMSHREGWGYDVQFHIRGAALDLDAIAERVSAMGESVLAAGDEHLIKVHVHTRNPGDILEYGAQQGSVLDVSIEDMQQQYVDFMARHAVAERRTPSKTPEDLSGAPPIDTGVQTAIGAIAVVPGSGLQRVFESLGITAILGGGATDGSQVELSTAIAAANANEVVILPNDKDVHRVAKRLERASPKQIAVIPSLTVPQGIAAALAFDDGVNLETNARRMAVAAQRVRSVELATATRPMTWNGRRVRAGEAIGFVDGELAASGRDYVAIAANVLLQAGARESAIISMYHGGDVTGDQAEALRTTLQQVFGDQEIELHFGGQPVSAYIIAVE